MARVFFISDLHFGHKHILKFSPSRGGASVEEHDEILVQKWNSVVTKRDLVYVLGDVCFSMERMPLLDQMNGMKKLVRGNHDRFNSGVYLKYFQEIYGFLRYKGFWISHAPIHPDELRGKGNIHGHVHSAVIPDPRYVSVCVEALDGYPIPFDKIQEGYEG